MIHILLPTMGRPHQAYTLVRKIEARLKEGFTLWVLLNKKEDIYPQDAAFSDRVNVRVAKAEGYWRVLNEFMPPDEPFICLADDINPKITFLDMALTCWNNHYPKGLGLIALNDGYVKWGGACFGMTTAKWLYVLFGEPRFPEEFGHAYLDTLVADRSKALDRYYFCQQSIVIHVHPVYGTAEFDDTYWMLRERSHGDKAIKDAMDIEWAKGGRVEARKRYEEMLGQDK